MANSYVQYTGTGSQTVYSVPFPYIDKAHVKVYVDGALVTNYSWTSTNVISFTPAPSSGVVIIIKRQTPSSALVDFTAKARWQTTDLNLAVKQSLYISEEAEERSTEWLSGTVSPATSLGAEGDFYLNETTLALYRKSSTDWRYIKTLLTSSGTNLQTVVDTKVHPVGSIAELRTLNSAAYSGSTVVLASWHSGLNYGGGVFKSITSSASDDGGMIIIDASGRRWSRMSDGPVSVTWFGAKNDGTDASSAFVSADAAATSRKNKVVIPEGAFTLSSSVTMVNEVVHQGTIVLGSGVRYRDANPLRFSEFRRRHSTDQAAFEAMLYELYQGFLNKKVADGEGMACVIDTPINVASVAGKTSYAGWHVIRNFNFWAGTNFPAKTTTTKTGSSTSGLATLTLANTTGITAGMMVTGAGLGRELYVKSVDSATQVTLNRTAYGTNASTTFTFTEFKYVLDWSGFTTCSRVSIVGNQFNLASTNPACVLRGPYDGIGWSIKDNTLNNIGERGFTDWNSGFSGMAFEGNEINFATSVQSVARGITVSAGDFKLRNNRITTCLNHVVIHEAGSLIVGNHLWGGDNASIILTNRTFKTAITGNYIDNSWIELSEEGDFSTTAMGGVSITGNIFTNVGSTASTRWIKLRPFQANKKVNSVVVTGNTFKNAQGTNPTRVEDVDTTNGTIDVTSFENVKFSNNAYQFITYHTASPATVRKTVTTATNNWVVDFSTLLPFGGSTLNVPSITLTNIKDGAAATAYPSFTVLDGNSLANTKNVQVRFAANYSGSAVVTADVNVLVEA